MSRRRGMSMIEALIAMMVGSLIAGIAVTLVGSLLRTEGIGRRHLAETRALDRLARQFLADAHSSTTASVPVVAADAKGPSPVLVLSSESGAVIEYQQHQQELTRRESRDGRIAWKESYRVPAGHALRATENAVGKLRWVGLTLDRAIQGAGKGLPPTRHGWNVTAELGRDRRLADVPRGQPREVAP